MKVIQITIEKAENGTIVRYWNDGIEKTQVFNDNKKLLEFIKKQLELKG